MANFSDFSGAPGGDPQTAVVNAETNTNPIAVVAMVSVTQHFLPVGGGSFTPPTTWSNAPNVYFVVFTAPTVCTTTKNGTFCRKDLKLDDFQPSPFAVLDSDGPKAVPGVCIACHGGTYNNASNTVAHARFLPFDTPSYIFDQTNSSFSAASQSEAFRTLNAIVRNSDTEGEANGQGERNDTIPTSQTIRDLINGWYPCGRRIAHSMTPSYRPELAIAPPTLPHADGPVPLLVPAPLAPSFINRSRGFIAGPAMSLIRTFSIGKIFRHLKMKLLKLLRNPTPACKSVNSASIYKIIICRSHRFRTTASGAVPLSRRILLNSYRTNQFSVR